jgi:hypothetical protein
MDDEMKYKPKDVKLSMSVWTDDTKTPSENINRLELKLKGNLRLIYEFRTSYQMSSSVLLSRVNAGIDVILAAADRMTR